MFKFCAKRTEFALLLRASQKYSLERLHHGNLPAWLYFVYVSAAAATVSGEQPSCAYLLLLLLCVDDVDLSMASLSWQPATFETFVSGTLMPLDPTYTRALRTNISTQEFPLP